MRKIIQAIGSNVIIRFIVIFFISFKSIFQRIWSNLKFKALVKNSGDSLCHYSTEIKYGINVQVGDNTRIGPNCTIGARSNVIIGDNVVISKNVTIESAGLDLKKGHLHGDSHNSFPIVIKDNAWIASNVMVLGGVTIGENSVIGAGSIVTKNIPPNSVFAGNPPKLIKKIV